MGQDIVNIDPEVESLKRLFASVSGGVWKVAAVVDEPQVVLYDWRIAHTNEGEYFIGSRDPSGGEGRVSTQVVTFDPETKRGVTMSGRVYELCGPGGYSTNGEYVWGRYKLINKLTEIIPPTEKKAD